MRMTFLNVNKSLISFQKISKTSLFLHFQNFNVSFKIRLVKVIDGAIACKSSQKLFFNAALIKLVGQIKICLLLRIQSKQNHILYM